jgi:hypothetical protein
MSWGLIPSAAPRMEISLTSVIYRIGLLGGALVLGALCLSGCGGDAEEKWWRERAHTQLTLVVDADEEVRLLIDSIRLEVFGEGNGWPPASLKFESYYEVPKNDETWGWTFSIVPEGNDANRPFGFFITGYSGGTRMISYRGYGNYAEYSNEIYKVMLTADCLSMFCPNSYSTCRQGRCNEGYLYLWETCNSDSDCSNASNDNYDCSIGTCVEGRCTVTFDDSECNAGQRCVSYQGCVSSNRFYVCEDGTAISPGYVCNGSADCADGGDERYCARVFGCYVNDWSTFGNIPLDLMCDGKQDCFDGSDEADWNCAGDEAWCPHLREQSIPVSSLCDGKTDYGDQSDEWWCTRTFNCDDGKTAFTDMNKICDGVADCEDGLDETSCTLAWGW